MPILEKIKQQIADILQISATDLIYPPQADLGDLSFPCFSLAKQSKGNPVLIAKDLADKWRDNQELAPLVTRLDAAGPYLNMFLRSDVVFSSLFKEINSKNCGREFKKTKEAVMIEFSNVNTHKEYHVGHLRNISYGAAVTNLLAAGGTKVIPVSYVNDFGIHVAKTLWFWPEYLKRVDKAAKGLDRGYLLGKCYSAASQKISTDDKIKEDVGRVMQAIESHEGKMYKLWQTTRSWSIAYFDKIYQDLGVIFKMYFYESDFIASGLKIVDELVKKGVLVKSQGAIIADLEKYGLGVLPVIRADGTALYPVADLALAEAKFKKFKITDSCYVIDVRQSLYFKQLFKVLQLSGYKEEMRHLSYEFVTLPSGMMASRTGNVITYQELKQAALAKLLAEVKNRHHDWSLKKQQKLAESLLIAALKFEMLKVSANKVIVFNIEEALRFDGYTALYLEYTQVRVESLLKKAGTTLKKPILKDLDSIILPLEKELLLKLAKYSEIVSKSALDFDPSVLAKYLFELSQIFNDYYHAVNILKSEELQKNWRLNLSQLIGLVIRDGLKILGLPIVSEM